MLKTIKKKSFRQAAVIVPRLIIYRLPVVLMAVLAWTVTLFLAALIAWQAPPIRWWITRQAAGAATLWLGNEVRLTPPEGNLPWNLRVSQLKIMDGGQPAIVAGNLHFRANWRRALRGQWVIEQATADRIEVQNWPSFANRRQGKNASRGRTPFQVKYVGVERIIVPAQDKPAVISLSGEVAGCRRAVHFDGRADIEWGDGSAVSSGTFSWFGEQGPVVSWQIDATTGGQGLGGGFAAAFSNLAARAVISGGGDEPLQMEFQGQAPALGEIYLMAEKTNRWSDFSERGSASLSIHGRADPDLGKSRAREMMPLPWLFQGCLDWRREEGRLVVSRAELINPAFSGVLEGAMNYRAGERNYQGEIHGQWAPDPATLLAAGVDFYEAPRFTGKFTFAEDRAEAEAWISANGLNPAAGLVAADLSLLQPTLHLSAKRQQRDNTEVEAFFSATDIAGQSVSGTARARQTEEGDISFALADWQWGDTGMAADGWWRSDQRVLRMEGKVTADWPGGQAVPGNHDLAGMAGVADLGFALEGDLPAGRWSIWGEGILLNSAFRDHRLGMALVEGRAERDHRGEWSAVAALQAEDAVMANGKTMAELITARVEKSGSDLAWSVAGDGQAAGRLLAVETRGYWLPGLGSLHVADLNISSPPLTLDNSRPLHLYLGGGTWSISDSSWRLNERKDLALSGWLSTVEGTLDIEGSIEGEIHPDYWMPALEGRQWRLQTEAQYRLWGETGAPFAELTARSGWTETGIHRLERRATASLDARLDDSGCRGELRLVASDGGGVIIGAEVPLARDNHDSAWQWSPGQNAISHVQGRMRLEWLLAPWLPDILRVTGLGEADAQIAWRPGSTPRISGHLSAREVLVDMPRWGMQLRNGALETESLDTATLEIGGQFLDTSGNIIKTGGQIGLTREGRPDLQLHFTSPRFIPVQTESFTVTSSMDLDLKGQPGNLELKGKVTLLDALFSGVPSLPLNVPQMEVVEINSEPDSAPDHEAEAGTADPEDAHALQRPTGFRCDILFVVGHEASLRSPDARMRWRGKLRLHGPAEALRMEGSYSLVHGHITLLGRRLSLEEGHLLFSGDPVPELEITAESRGGGVVAQLVVSGPADRPSIRVASDPPMAEDEILSYILFRRGLARIGPYQAYQLAQVLRRLQGGGGDSLDLLGHGRKLLPVDEIDLVYTGPDDSDEESAAITVAKYVGPRLYLAGTQGLETGTGRVSLEVELTRNITLESEVRADMRSGLGLSWRWDY